MLQPGVACVLDVETTGLLSEDRVIEVAAVDAHDGSVLIDTLVHPGPGITIPAGATRVHGITDSMVADARAWSAVLPEVLAAVGERVVLAYNSDFDAPARARQLDQQHAVRGRIPLVLRGHVGEVAADHRRADQVDLPLGHHPVDHRPVRLDLRRRPVGVPPAMAHVHVWCLAVPAVGVLPQMQIGQVQTRQPPDPHRGVGKPGHDHPVTSRVHDAQKVVPGPIGQHLRMTAPSGPSRAQRIGRHRLLHVPQECPAPVGLRRQSPPGELGRQCVVDPSPSTEVQVEALEASRCDLKGRVAAGALRRNPPRLPVGHHHLRADRPHVAMEVEQPHLLGRQSFPDAPAEVIDEAVGIRPLRARAVVLAKEPVRLLVDHAVRPQDRVRPSTAGRQRLDP
ncbi:3'-5' exonuclease [Streptomyces erythrochromogenes]